MVVQSSMLLAELCETLSHRARSSLTVVCGALDDLASGYTLEANELKDARESAAKLVSGLDALQALGRSLQSSAEYSPESLTAKLEQALAAVRR